MKNRLFSSYLSSLFLLFLFGTSISDVPKSETETENAVAETDIALNITASDTDRAVVPKPNNNPLENEPSSPFYLKKPSNQKKEVVYDPATNTYVFQNKIGTLNDGPAAQMSLEDYKNYDIDKAMNDYWRERAKNASGQSSSSGLLQLRVPLDAFEDLFGSPKIEIRPSGSVELVFKVIHNATKNPNVIKRNQKQTHFDFDANIQMNLKAKIGDKIGFDLNYNTLAQFSFENKFKLRYEGKEDEIIKLLEFGNVTMPLSSRLIQGSQTLFGAKAQLQFGKLMLTAVVSQQEGNRKTINIQNGSALNEFDFRADEYEEDKHFFLAQYFYDHYNEALSTLPLVNSRINITRIEVWRTNIGAAVNENRNVIAITDLGEPDPYNTGFHRTTSKNLPDSGANDFLQGINYALLRDVNTAFSYLSSYRNGMSLGIDFEKVESARLLSSNEYTFNSKLGFISLMNKLTPGQVLSVAFQYTVLGDPKVYQVGQFSNEVEPPNCVMTKLLSSHSVNPQIPMWKLMMKNVYSLNVYSISPEEFRLNILHNNGVPMGYFPDAPGDLNKMPLIRMLGADRLNQQMADIPDGLFDYIDNAATDGGTVQSNTGKIYLPLVEPFGKDLRAALAADPAIAEKYAFDSLYTLPKVLAQQHPDKNKFYLEGRYKSSMGSMITLGMGNLEQGSVRVTAGGIELKENTDYTVDYNLGMLTITNPSYMQSGTPISISLESKNLFGQKKTMFGLNAEYSFSKNFVVGATILNLRERPPDGIVKVRFGEEPINNTIWGMNATYQTKSRWITKMLNYLPFYKSATESQIQLSGEFAHFIPGHSRLIGRGEKAELYVDDFEAAVSTSHLGLSNEWKMASIPQHQTSKSMFPEGAPNMGLASGYNRALLSWYNIDPILHEKKDANTISNGTITPAMRSNMYARRVNTLEVFPNRPLPVNSPTEQMLSTFDLAFFPNQRGPYNFDALGSSYSSGLDADGTLKNPASRWAGVMRKLINPDFETNNYEYVQFWLLDPFLDNPNSAGGKFYINLGQISEDILRDGRKSSEIGLPSDGSADGTETTVWGRVPLIQPLVPSFDNNVPRKYIDVGLDGLHDESERTHYASYLSTVQGIVNPSVFQSFMEDPSADNYHFWRGADYNQQGLDIVSRYKKFSNQEGNSVADEDRSEDAKRNGYIEQATSRPDIEDINNDNTMSEDEQYYQYEMDIRPDKLVIGKNYITDIQESRITLEDGSQRDVRWYQFKVPIRVPDKTIGNIMGFSSIRFMRMFLKGFTDSVVFRMAELSLVRGDWRQYTGDLREDGPYPGGGKGTAFHVSTLSLQENANRQPIPYAMPAPVRQEYNYMFQQALEMNEQSLTLRATNLSDGDARAVYKNTRFDFRRFGSLRFYLHGEKVFEEDDEKDLEDNLRFFIRLGTDFTENYYEYETSFQLTPWGTTDSAQIWYQNNYITVDLQKLIDIKQERNKVNRNDADRYDPTKRMPYPVDERYPVDRKSNIYVLGNPSLDNVRVIMMGIRNPRKRSEYDPDDMLPKSVEVWVNELRLGNFEEKSGWAALGNARITLADLGDISLSAGISTPGFGALESSTYERQLFTQTTADIAANIQMGKMLPQKWEINVPLHYDFSRKVESPEYNPLNNDVFLKEDLKTYHPDDREGIKKQAVDFIQRQNVNVLNARKGKGPKAKNWVWNISNFDFSYAYTEMKSYNLDMEYNNLFTHRGGIGYVFNCNPTKVQPFKKIEKSKNKNIKSWFQLISDFNFYPYPKNYSFRTEVFRSLGETMLRNISKGEIIMEPYYAKAFEWQRDYAMAWDLTASLKADYSASARAFITEPQGRLDTKIKRDSVWRSFGEFGKMNSFQQRFNASYQIPINKIPIFSFITSSVGYQANYMWTAAAPAIAYVGNNIENNNTKTFTATANFVNLYAKSKYLKKVNQGTFGSSMKDPSLLKKNRVEKVDFSKVKLSRQEQDSIRKAEKALEEARKNYGKEVLDNFLRLAMLLKNINFSYNEGRGTSMPGYMLEPDLLGMTFNRGAAPGFLFVFGGQNDNIRHIAAKNDWLTKDDRLNTPYMQQMSKTLSVKVTLEPLKSFKIDLTGTRVNSEIDQIFHLPDSNGIYYDDQRTKSGTFSITTVCIGTLFAKNTLVKEQYINPNFENFKNYRLTIANRLADRREAALKKEGRHYARGNGEFPDGYGALDQEVLLYSFLAAYSGKSPDAVAINTPLTRIPLPNWQVNYTGLTKLPGMDKYFQSINIRHGYDCRYQLAGYGRSVMFDYDLGEYQDLRNDLDNFIPLIETGGAAIIESMNPVIGFDMNMKNSLQFKAEWRKSRNITLSMANYQISEMSNDDLIFGAGYRFKGLKVTFDFAGIQHTTDGDLTVRVDLSIRDNKTILRQIAQETNTASTGQRVVSITAYGEYQVTKNVSGKVFYNHTFNHPHMANGQYNTTNIEAGIAIKIMLTPM